MRLLRIAAVLLLAATGTLVTAFPAHAGGWATTLLDPLPDRLEAGRTYAIGYWVLQHGSHPYTGDLGRTGLVLTDDAGTSTTYVGTPLPEPAHYATAVVFIHSGGWKLTSLQGIFAEYEIGDATVPGGVHIKPTPAPMVFDPNADYWGAIRPPLSADPMPAEVAGSPSPVAAAAPGSSSGWSMMGPLVAGVALAAVGLTLLAVRLWRPRSRARIGSRPDVLPPAEPAPAAQPDGQLSRT